MRLSTLTYVGWFGPRGLATLILTIEVIGSSGLDHASTIAHTALFTVALSVLAHWRDSVVGVERLRRCHRTTSGRTGAHGERTDCRRRSPADAVIAHSGPAPSDQPMILAFAVAYSASSILPALCMTARSASRSASVDAAAASRM